MRGVTQAGKVMGLQLINIDWCQGEGGGGGQFVPSPSISVRMVAICNTLLNANNIYFCWKSDSDHVFFFFLS